MVSSFSGTVFFFVRYRYLFNNQGKCEQLYSFFSKVLIAVNCYPLHIDCRFMQVLKYSIALQLNYLEIFFPIHIVMTPIIFNDMQGS
jgi:hypothetical protein